MNGLQLGVVEERLEVCTGEVITLDGDGSEIDILGQGNLTGQSLKDLNSFFL